MPDKALYPLPHSPFFIVSCGCIGLDIGHGLWTAIKRCDADYYDDQPSIEVDCRKYDPDKTYTPLDLEQSVALLEDLSCLVHGGHRLDEVRHALGGRRVKLPYRLEVLSPEDAKGRPDYSKHYLKVTKNDANDVVASIAWQNGPLE